MAAPQYSLLLKAGGREFMAFLGVWVLLAGQGPTAGMQGDYRPHLIDQLSEGLMENPTSSKLRQCWVRIRNEMKQQHD